MSVILNKCWPFWFNMNTDEVGQPTGPGPGDRVLIVSIVLCQRYVLDDSYLCIVKTTNY